MSAQTIAGDPSYKVRIAHYYELNIICLHWLNGRGSAINGSETLANGNSPIYKWFF